MMVLSKAHSKRAHARRREMRNLGVWVMMAGAVLLVSAALLLARPASSNVSGPARIGQAMPDFVLSDLSGRPVRLSDYAGQVVLINAWATWCPPCRAEMPALHEFYQLHRAEGFELLAVNAGEDHATANGFIAQMGFTFPVLLDPGTRLLHGLGIDAFPTSVLIGRDGVVKATHIGYYAPEALTADISPLLSQ